VHRREAALLAGCLLLLPAAITALRAQAPEAIIAKPADQPRLVVQLGHFFPVTSIAFSADDRQILTGSADNTAEVWDTETGAELRALTGHTRGVNSVAFSPNGLRAVTGSNDTTAKIWDLVSGREVHSLAGHSGPVTSAVFSNDGRRVLTGSRDGTAKLWDADTGQEIRTFASHSHLVESGSSPIRSVAISPNGDKVLTGGEDYRARLWDADSGEELVVFEGHAGPIESVAFSPDGRQVLTGSSDQTAKIWDAKTGNEILTLQPAHFNAVKSVAFSPDGREVLTGCENGATQLFNAKTGQELRSFTGHLKGINSVAFSHASGRVLTGSTDGTAKLWDKESGDEIRTFRGYSDPVLRVAISPDSRHILAASYDQTAKLWETTTGEFGRSLAGHLSWVEGIAFSPDGRRVVTGGDDNTAQLWDVETGERIRVFQGHTAQVWGVAFSPDGRRILTGSWDKTAKLWDVETGREIRSFEGHLNVIRTVAFSPDGRQVLTGSDDCTAKLWDAETGREIRSFTGHTKLVSAVAFSPDGRQVLTASWDQTAKLWNAQTGELIRTFSGHKADINSAMFSHDGLEILTGSWDQTAKLWDAGTGAIIHTLSGHSGGGVTGVFSDDRRKVLTGSDDGTVKIWDAESGLELCTLVIFKDGTWAVVDRVGRYDASNGGDVPGLHWVIGNLPIDLWQLKQRYYDPGLLAKYMGFNKQPLLEVAKLEAPKLFPDVSVSAPSPGSTTLRIHLGNQSGGIGKVRVLVNGKEVAADARGAKPNPDSAKADLSVDLAGAAIAPGQANHIEVVAWNAEGYLSSRGVTAEWTAPGTADSGSPELDAVVAGVSEYADHSLHLNYSSQDAEAFAHALELGGKRLFGADKVHITLLASSGKPGEMAPTKENLQQAFEAAQKTKPGDVFLVYLAGHGVALSGLYAYPTAEAHTLDLSDPAVRAQTAITSEELVDWIKRVPARHQVMILDTCAAGAAVTKLVEKRDVPGDQVRALDELKDRTGFYVLMGSAADAVSYEASRYGEGLLTYALLKGMKGAALKNDVDVDVSKLFQFAVDDVPGLARGIGGVQRPQVITPTGGASFDVGQLQPEDQEQIQLAVEKPIFLRPQIVNAEGPDDLDLAAAVRHELRSETDVSARGDERLPNAVFVDADEMPGAIRVSGTYVVQDNVVTAKLWLAREKARTQIVVESAADDMPALARKITSAILEAGNRL